MNAPATGTEVRYFKAPFPAADIHPDAHGDGTWYAEFVDGIARRQFEVLTHRTLVAPHDGDFADQYEIVLTDNHYIEITLAEFEAAWQKYAAPRLAEIAYGSQTDQKHASDSATHESGDDSGEDLRIWIEAESWVPGEWTPQDDNTDVIVTRADGSRWVASFFSYQNIVSLTRKNERTGECLSGEYLWSSDMILVRNVSRPTIERVIRHLIEEGEFEQVFTRIPKEDTDDVGEDPKCNHGAR